MTATDVTTPMPGDWLVIAGERLNTDPKPYGYGPVADWTLEDQINTQTVTVGATVTEPDPKWIHVDTAGHAHAWASPPAGAPGRPNLPTLRRTVEDVPCPNGPGCVCDGEGSTRDVYHCTACDEQVEPGYRPTPGPWSRDIVTGAHTTLTIGHHVIRGATPEWLLPLSGVITPATSFEQIPVHGVLGGVLRFGFLTRGDTEIEQRFNEPAVVRVELVGFLHKGIGLPDSPPTQHEIPATT